MGTGVRPCRLWAILPVFLAAGLIVLVSKVGSSAIRNSHHDFSTAAWSSNEICRPCHTPHNANLALANAPLWNHQLTTSSFTLYNSPLLNGTVNQPGPTSLLCLSCHDGSVAVDAFGGQTGTYSLQGSFGGLGTDLSDDHPIGIEYTQGTAAADGELHNPTTTPSGLGGTIQEDLLINGRIECPTCHDVHVSRNTSGCFGCHSMMGSTVSLSLRIDNSGSAFCLTCHNK